jgi:TolB protein
VPSGAAADEVTEDSTSAMATADRSAEGHASDAAASPASQPQPQAAQPYQSVTSGMLVFQSDVAGRPKIFTLDVANGQVRQLTSGTDWRDESPRWSPDGQWIAFTSNRAHYGAEPEGGTPDLDVYVMRADGTQVRRITTDAGNDHDPSWTPDGQALVFSSDRASRGDLYRVRIADGHTDRLTTSFVGRAIMPAVSPDGRTVAFAAQTLRVGAFWNFQVHLLDVASGRTTPVPASGGACWPAWSPDGKLLYNVQLEVEPSAIQRRDVSTGEVRLAHANPTLWSYYPRVSPDGQWLALSLSPEHHDGENWDLALVSTSDPARRLPLTTGPGNDRLPDWRPR